MISDPRAGAARGCVDAGNLEKALVYLRMTDDRARKDKALSAVMLADAFLGADRIDDAERVYAEFKYIVDDWDLFSSDLYIAARIRRGDDVAIDGNFPGSLASAAVATFVHVNTMRKRIEEYAEKR